MDYIEVDGSEGEGGGQILRTAVAFSSILGTPVRVSRVRAGRAEPGLKTQHISALKVLSQVFGGELSGASLGSSEVRFIPGDPRSGVYSADMGTAASITLVLQAVVPAVALSGSRITLTLSGGTDVPWSPTLDYFQSVVRGAFGSAGISFQTSAGRRGYYPRGGGVVTATVEPCSSVRPLVLGRAPSITAARVVSRCGRLPRHVAERQLDAASGVLRSEGFSILEAEASAEDSDSPGSSIVAYSSGEGGYVGADALGRRGVKAEEVGEDAGRRFVAAARSGGALDANVADMLIPLLSLSDGVSRVCVQGVSEHLKSGMKIAAQFTSSSFAVSRKDGEQVVQVSPGKGRRA